MCVGPQCAGPGVQVSVCILQTRVYLICSARLFHTLPSATTNGTEDCAVYSIGTVGQTNVTACSLMQLADGNKILESQPVTMVTCMRVSLRSFHR